VRVPAVEADVPPGASFTHHHPPRAAGGSATPVRFYPAGPHLRTGPNIHGAPSFPPPQLGGRAGLMYLPSRRVPSWKASFNHHTATGRRRDGPNIHGQRQHGAGALGLMSPSSASYCRKFVSTTALPGRGRDGPDPQIRALRGPGRFWSRGVLVGESDARLDCRMWHMVCERTPPGGGAFEEMALVQVDGVRLTRRPGGAWSPSWGRPPRRGRGVNR